MTETIIIFSVSYDLTSDFLADKLKDYGIKNVLRINADKLYQEMPLFAFNIDNNLIVNDLLITPSDCSVFYRRLNFVSDENIKLNKNEKLSIEQWNGFNNNFVYALDDSFWISHPLNIQKASRKFIQLKYAQKIGFKTPLSIISNDLQKVKEKFNRKVTCFKTLEQTFWVDDEKSEGIYTNKININSLSFDETKSIPVIWQEYIEKHFEVRVTVVGNQIFACKIESQSSEISNIDWRRYDFKNVPHYIIEIPSLIKKQIFEMMSMFSLNFAAFDFIVDKNEEYIFLEINPVGQWLWIEELTGLKITDEICNLLINRKYR